MCDPVFISSSLGDPGNPVRLLTASQETWQQMQTELPFCNTSEKTAACQRQHKDALQERLSYVVIYVCYIRANCDPDPRELGCRIKMGLAARPCDRNRNHG